MPPRSFHLPLAVFMQWIFINVVLLPYSSLSIPGIECTAGIVLVFLQVKKWKNIGWMSCSTLEYLCYRWRWLMNFRYIFQRGPTARWWNFGKVKMDGLQEVLLLTPYPNCQTFSSGFLQYVYGTLSLLPCTTRWYFQVWDTILPGNFQHAPEAFYTEGLSCLKCVKCPCFTSIQKCGYTNCLKNCSFITQAQLKQVQVFGVEDSLSEASEGVWALLRPVVYMTTFSWEDVTKII